MAAKADLLRFLEDLTRSEDEVFADVLGAARRRKMSTEAVLRVCADVGAILPLEKPQTVEEAVTFLVHHTFSIPEAAQPSQEVPIDTNDKQDQDPEPTVSTNDVPVHPLVGMVESLTAMISELQREINDLKTSKIFQLQKEITDLKTLFASERAEAHDRDQRQKNRIKNLERMLLTHAESVDKASDMTSTMLKSIDAKSTTLTNELKRAGASAGPRVNSPSVPYTPVPATTKNTPEPVATHPSPASPATTSDTLPHSKPARKPPSEVPVARKDVQPLPLDDDDDLWSLVTKSKPTERKSAVYVGNLEDNTSEEQLREYIQRRSNKAGIKPPTIHRCSILRREEGELGRWGAHITLDRPSLKYVCSRNFWPGRLYARPWVFRNKEQGKQDAHRNGENEFAPAGERSATAPDTSVDSAHPWVFRESREKEKDNVEPREKQTHTDGQ